MLAIYSAASKFWEELIFFSIEEIEKRVSASYEAKKIREVRKRWKTYDAGSQVSFGKRKAVELMETTEKYYKDENQKQLREIYVRNKFVTKYFSLSFLFFVFSG